MQLTWRWIVLAALAAVCFTWNASVNGDDQASPYPAVISSQNGRYYFRMLPMPNCSGKGTLFKVGRESDEVVWSVEGWYARDLHVCDTGSQVAVVRLGEWPERPGPKEDDLAVAFYVNGVLVRRYSTRELIREGADVRQSKSHYDYKNYGSNRLTYRTVKGVTAWFFEFETVDGLNHVFDPISGIRVAPGEPEAEKPRR